VKSRKPVRRGIGVLIAAFLLLAIVLGVLVFRKYEGAKTPPPVPAVQDNAGFHPVALFFAAQSGDALVREWREVEPCDEISDCLEGILEELINGPVGDLAPVLPITGMFNSVKLEGDVARVDFAGELLDALPAGSSSEMMAAYAVVDSLVFNYPQVRKVQFTLDGKPLQTLKGHLDVRVPLAPDFTLEKRVEVPASLKEKKQ
jgi:spore germination protein GerM